MSIRKEDTGELAYGGLVTATEWWDQKRIDEGKITEKDILKKYSTYAYVVPGGLATIFSAFGVWRRMERWNEHISHGFIYDFPRFLKNVVNAMREGGAGAKSAAVREAQRILRDKQRAAALLGSGRGTGRTYEPELEPAGAKLF